MNQNINAERTDSEKKDQERVTKPLNQEDVLIFLRGTSDVNKGDAQDGKDKSGE